MGLLTRSAYRAMQVLLVVMAVSVLAAGAEGMEPDRPLGVVGKSTEDGFPVIYKFVDEVPNEEIRIRFPWVTVVSWKYDRDVRNGMPPEETNKQMLGLEDALDGLAAAGLCRHAYSRTGNGLKELVYYISDRDQFMKSFNTALELHPRYPVEIDFYNDPEWDDFRKLRSMFKKH
jgi:hypothetical protein